MATKGIARILQSKGSRYIQWAGGAGLMEMGGTTDGTLSNS